MTASRGAAERPKDTVSSVRVAIADDDALVRRTIAAIVDFEKDLELVGEAENTDGAIEMALEADVLVADVRMPGGGAAVAANALRTLGSPTSVVALTGSDSASDRAELTEAGVVAYLVKGCEIEEIIEAIRTAAKATQASRLDSRRFATSSSIEARANGASAFPASSA